MGCALGSLWTQRLGSCDVALPVASRGLAPYDSDRYGLAPNGPRGLDLHGLDPYMLPGLGLLPAVNTVVTLTRQSSKRWDQVSLLCHAQFAESTFSQVMCLYGGFIIPSLRHETNKTQNANPSRYVPGYCLGYLVCRRVARQQHHHVIRTRRASTSLFVH